MVYDENTLFFASVVGIFLVVIHCFEIFFAIYSDSYTAFDFTTIRATPMEASKCVSTPVEAMVVSLPPPRPSSSRA
jgi:hypothetical protein